jgi:hypothetical protein
VHTLGAQPQGLAGNCSRVERRGCALGCADLARTARPRVREVCGSALVASVRPEACEPEVALPPERSHGRRSLVGRGAAGSRDRRSAIRSVTFSIHM